ncbi:MAG: class I SAM-dependent methyltransferase [Proteobacteria bacterium]|nr:class I SAM-dependent methyltransferase [Pseudomonadota bacterium]
MSAYSQSIATVFTLAWLAGCGPAKPTPEVAAEAPAAAAEAVESAASESAEDAAPEASLGLNERFLDPEMKVDEWVERFGAESREVVLRQPQVLEALALEPGARVADIGAGTGLYVAPFAEAVGAEGKVYAVEISPGFLDLLRTSATDNAWTQVEVVEGTERSPELPANSVDVVFICDTYHHFDHPQDMLKSIHDALAPGGVLYLLDFKRIEGESSDWILGHVRAGQQVFSDEVVAAGFVDKGAVDVGLEENYLVRFEKAPAE